MGEREERLSFLQKLGAKETNTINSMQTTDAIRYVLLNVQNGNFKSMQDFKDANIDIETIFAGDYIARIKLESMFQSWKRKDEFREREAENEGR